MDKVGGVVSKFLHLFDELCVFDFLVTGTHGIFSEATTIRGVVKSEMFDFNLACTSYHLVNLKGRCCYLFSGLFDAQLTSLS